MSQLLATLYPSTFIPPKGRLVPRARVIPQKDELKVPIEVRAAVKARCADDKQKITAALVILGTAKASQIAEISRLSLPCTSNHLITMAKRGDVIKDTADKRTAVYSLAA